MPQKTDSRRVRSGRLSAIRLSYRMARVPVALLLALFVSGCQTLDRNELTWQTLHAIDVAQTLNAANDPCYMEKAWLTQRLIGEQPSEASVVLWGVGTAIAHKLVADLMERRGAPGWAQKLWDFGTISHTGYAVVTNHHNGVRPWGDNQLHNGCYR